MKQNSLVRNLTICLSFVMAASAVFYYLTHAYILSQAEKNIQNLLLSHKGIHHYVQNRMLPALYDYKKRQKIPEDFYAPELFSSSFIVRNQHEFYNQERVEAGYPELYYKLAANNPRNPVNKADALEKALIEKFNKDRSLKINREIVEIDNKEYLYVAMPFLQNDQRCMVCHGKREDAPLELQEKYPGEGGFNEKIGEIRAITSIRAPIYHEHSLLYIIFPSMVIGSLAFGLLLFFNSQLRSKVRLSTKSLKAEVAKKAELAAKLLKSETLYRSLVDNMDLGVTLIDKDLTIVMANAAQERLFQKSRGYFEGRKCFQEFEKRDDVCPHCPGLSAMKLGKTVEAVTQGVRDDGELFTVRIRAFPLNEGENDFDGFIEVVEDITAQVKDEENLAQEKERLAVTLRSIGDGVITASIDGKVQILNKVAEELTGYSQEDAVGLSLHEVFHIVNEHTRQRCESLAEKILATGKIIALANHTLLISQDGTERIIADSGAPIRDKNSEIVGVVIVFRDITEESRVERELLKVKKLESIGVLAGGIAHDFNNILAGVLGYINLSLYDETLQDKTRSYLKEAETASMRAKDLTKQLLTFSRGGDPVKETASLREVIQESTSFVLHGDKVKCTFDIPEDLWLVDVDKGQFGQVIQNIVLNASHAMPNGGQLHVKCENRLPAENEPTLPGANEFVKVTIQDTGGGIPAAYLDQIFDPYFSTKQEGSGLGLAITHSIINKHGGQITANSSPGVGTTFTILLPASPAALKTAHPGPETITELPQATILFMDDEEVVRNVTQAMLNQLGHKVLFAVDGDQAVSIYRENQETIDIIIMDLTIPGGKGGEEAVREILAINPGAKVIVSSGYSTDPIMANHRKYGFCAAVVKPYQLQDLSSVLSKVLQ